MAEFSITVRINDARALRTAAIRDYLDDNTRCDTAYVDALALFGNEGAPNVQACLVQLLDPRELPGCEILDSGAVTDDEGEALAPAVRRIYEITAAGFDGGTDETDDRVFWVEADSSEQVRDAIKDCGAILCGLVTPDHGVTAAQVSQSVDFKLPGEALNLSEELLRWVGIERNKNRAA